MADKKILVTLLRLRQVLNANLEIVLSQAVMQVARTEKEIEHIEIGDQPAFTRPEVDCQVFRPIRLT